MRGLLSHLFLNGRLLTGEWLKLFMTLATLPHKLLWFCLLSLVKAKARLRTSFPTRPCGEFSWETCLCLLLNDSAILRKSSHQKHQAKDVYIGKYPKLHGIIGTNITTPMWFFLLMFIAWINTFASRSTFFLAPRQWNVWNFQLSSIFDAEKGSDSRVLW